jgi:hypothetical protein
MSDDFMFVQQKTDGDDKRTKIIACDNFAKKGTPIARRHLIDLVQIDQRKQALGWV